MSNGIRVNEELLFELTSRYAREYGNLPNTHKQAIQYAYICGRTDQKHEEQDTMVILTKHEIEVITNGVLDKLLYMANEKSQYENINGDVETVILYDTLSHIVRQLKK